MTGLPRQHCLPAMNMQQLWNYQVVESVMDIHRNFWSSSFLLSQMVLFEQRKQNLQPYELWYFTRFFSTDQSVNEVLFLLCKHQMLQSPNLGTSKICKNTAQFCRKADSLHTVLNIIQSRLKAGLESIQMFCCGAATDNLEQTQSPGTTRQPQASDGWWFWTPGRDNPKILELPNIGASQNHVYGTSSGLYCDYFSLLQSLKHSQN